MKRKNMKKAFAITAFALASIASTAQAATMILYSQDFEQPIAFQPHPSIKDFTNLYTQNNYAAQSNGHIRNNNQMGTLHITGGTAFGDGYKDPTGKGGNYALGVMGGPLPSRDTAEIAVWGPKMGSISFSMDISRIGLDHPTSAFATGAPVFRVTLLGAGKDVLGVQYVGGTDSGLNDTFKWSKVSGTFDLSAHQWKGGAYMLIDLESGGYGVIDNLTITGEPTDLACR